MMSASEENVKDGRVPKGYKRVIPVIIVIIALCVLELFFSLCSVFSCTIDHAAAGAAYQQVTKIHLYTNKRCTFI